MENEKTRQSNRERFNRLINNKRTLSSEQSYNNRSNHQRKFTIQYIDHKKSLRQPLVQRKNQSLPRALLNGRQTAVKQNIRSRKLIYSSNSSYNDQKQTNKAINIRVISSQRQIANDFTKNKQFSEGIILFTQNKYQQASLKFIKVYNQIGQAFAKNIYYLGLCQWHLRQSEKAIFHLSKSLDLGFQFSTQSYDLLACFYESTKNYNCALKTLDQWIKSQVSSKAYIMRARIFYHFKQYAKAIADYSQSYRVEPTKLQAYIQQIQAVYRLHGLQTALQKYNQLLLIYPQIWPQSQSSDINYVKYKKSLLLLQQKRYAPALNLLKQVSNQQLQSQVNYYIGVTLVTLGDLQQAALAFNKAIQANTSSKFASQSYYQKLVLMFKQNQFYAIQHQFDIIGQQFQDNESLQILKMVIQGIIYVLKMNFALGLKVLKQALALMSNNASYLKLYSNTISSFTIFSYYSLHHFDQALQQFTMINLRGRRMSDSNRYNYTILKSIKNAIDSQFNQSLKLFEEAQKIQPFNNHTYMVKSIVEIMFYNSIVQSDAQCQQITSANQSSYEDNKKKDKQQSNQQILLSAQQLMNRCLLKQTQNDQILYILAALNYQLGQYESGLKLIRKAIDSSDDHTVKHYYLKANLKIMLDMSTEAINDYTNAILVMAQNQSMKHTDDMETKPQAFIPQCYLERAKCYILDSNLQKAESDLRHFFSQLDNVRKYESQLYLFMHVGCSNVILDIYKSIIQQEYDPYNKMKCYYLNKQLNNCLNIMAAMLELHQDQEQWKSQCHFNRQKLTVDRDCLEALKKSAQGSSLLIKLALQTFQYKIQKRQQGQIFKKSDCFFYAGVMSFHLQQYGKAKNYFIDAKSQKLENNEISRNQSHQESIQNQLFSLQEINYNIGICDFIQGKWNNYLQQYSQFKKHHQSVTENLLAENQEATPFIVKNRLCSIYPPQKVGNLSFRLSFCLPKIKIKQVKFTKNCNIIKSISLNDIDMRPSAPWIQKNKKGIIFTSQILKQSIDFKSEKSRKHNNKKKGEQRYKQKSQN